MVGVAWSNFFVSKLSGCNSRGFPSVSSKEHCKRSGGLSKAGGKTTAVFLRILNRPLWYGCPDVGVFFLFTSQPHGNFWIFLGPLKELHFLKDGLVFCDDFSFNRFISSQNNPAVWTAQRLQRSGGTPVVEPWVFGLVGLLLGEGHHHWQCWIAKASQPQRPPNFSWNMERNNILTVNWCSIWMLKYPSLGIWMLGQPYKVTTFGPTQTFPARTLWRRGLGGWRFGAQLATRFVAGRTIGQQDAGEKRGFSVHDFFFFTPVVGSLFFRFFFCFFCYFFSLLI